MKPDSATVPKVPQTDGTPWCVGCGKEKELEDLYEYPDGMRCYDCCARSEKNAADTILSLSLSERIAIGLTILK